MAASEMDLEHWLRQRLARAIEAGEVPEYLLRDVARTLDAAHAAPPGEALAEGCARYWVREIGLTDPEAHWLVAFLDRQAPAVQEALFKRAVEGWLESERQRYTAEGTMATLREDPALPEAGRTRRAHPRVVLPAPIRAVLGDRRAVRILDLSPAGARIAHHDMLPPHDRCALHFAVEDQPATVTAHLVWSSVVRRAQGPGRRPLFTSGLVFAEVPPATQQVLATALTAPGAEALRAAVATPTRAFPSPEPAEGPPATADPGGKGGTFSAEAVRAAWAWAGRRCECEEDGHGHLNHCACQLIWSRRGSNRAGGWEARRRQPAMPEGTEAENCEIVCWLCYELDLPVPVEE